MADPPDPGDPAQHLPEGSRPIDEDPRESGEVSNSQAGGSNDHQDAVDAITDLLRRSDIRNRGEMASAGHARSCDQSAVLYPLGLRRGVRSEIQHDPAAPGPFCHWRQTDADIRQAYEP